MKAKATKAEIRLINTCNHGISTDAKVAALRRHVARAVKRATEEYRPRHIVYFRSGVLRL